MTKLVILATDNTDNTITVAIDGTRYEFWLRRQAQDAQQRLQFLLRQQLYGAGIAWLKKESWKCDRLG